MYCTIMLTLCLQYLTDIEYLILIALMMAAARTSKASVDIQLRTRQYIPEDSELHTRSRENLKSQLNKFVDLRM
jgi:hypothetical protein